MDAIERIERATALASEKVGNVKADQLGDATPCSEFDVKALLRHMIGGLDMLTTAAAGGKAEMPAEDLIPDGADVSAMYDERRAKLLETIKGAGVLDKTWEMPFGQMPGKMMAGIAFMEHVTHAWDVAKATGQDTELPGELVKECSEVVTPMDAMLRMPGVCGPAIEAHDGATETEKLMAFLGRTV
jgi:uncharacterized protein (TIGR03086 family)